MKHRTWILIVVIAVMLSTLGLVPAMAAPGHGQALIKIAIEGSADLALVEVAGVPVYVRLTADAGSYLIGGAEEAQIRRLQAEGLRVTVLDPEMQGAAYYLAYPMPGQDRPTWNAYGQLLHDDGVQALLRMSPQNAERLAEAGAELRAVTLDPKPFRPALVEGAIPAVIEPDPLIQLMIDQIDTDLVYQYTGNISGEWPVEIGGQPYTIATRHTYSGTPIEKATQFVGEHLAALGLDVEYHNWSSPQYPNVIAELPGLLDPDEIWIICGHIDDMPSGGFAPGADDNGSGTITTLIAADILTQFQWGSTLRFALWTGEEQGLLGSHAYAQRAFSNGENIAGVLNLDMVAWNTFNTNPTIDLHADSSLPPTLDLAQLMADVIDAYSLNLIPEIVPNGSGSSDHASFWDYGYTAILGIEDFSDFNPYYHTTADDMDNLQDWPYYVDFVKASVATFAHMSGSLIPSGLGTLEGTVTAATGGAPIEGATVVIDDGMGHSFTTVTDPSGYYSRSLLSGFYDVTASAYGYLPETVTGVEIIADTVTTQDFSLTTAPAYTVQGYVTEAGTGIPLEAEVEFEGSPVTVWTSPSTGFYQAELSEGEYIMQVRAELHRPEDRPIVVDHNQNQHFALEPLPCILLVDDDGDNPDVRSYYTNALDNLGLDYDLWNVMADGDPVFEDIFGYNMVVWWTGYPWGSTFTSANEAAVGAYLDAGGRFFLSSQDYLYDSGITLFGQNYLHIASYSNDVSQTTVTGQNVFSGLGPYSLSYPFTNYSDIVNPDAQAQIAFVGNQGNAAISYDGGSFQTVFLGFPLEAMPNLADRSNVLGTLVDWFGGCEPPPPQDTLHVQAIKMKYLERNGKYAVFSTLRILDQDNQPISEALVSGEWTLPDGSTAAQEAPTSFRGIARYRVKSTQTGLYGFCVTDVVKAGYVYDPDQNGETCDELVVP
jgi:hypothetical protein